MEEKNNCNKYNNSEFLIKQICNELKKRDKNKNGLILYNPFVEVMDMFQIEYGSTVIDYLMKHCFVTEDGFVNYKKLLLIHDPSKTIRNNSECIAESINPKNIYIQDNCDDINNYMKKKNEIIRKLYSQWDKCLLKDEEFKSKLISANIELTPEFERSLYLYGPSRTLSFANVMKTLYINNSKDRKNRNNFVDKINDGKWCELNVNENVQCFQESNRNPIAWEEPNVIDTSNLIESIEAISNYLNGEENFALNKRITKEFFNNTIKNLIKNYIANKISDREFYICLSKLNITITPELNNLIKYHEYDNYGKFKDFATIIHRYIPKNISRNLQTSIELSSNGENDTHTNLNCTFYNIHNNNNLSCNNISNNARYNNHT